MCVEACRRRHELGDNIPLSRIAPSPRPRGRRRVKIIYRAENIIDAHLVKGALASEDIIAFVAGEYLTGAIGELPLNNLVNVMVSDNDVERAGRIAAAIDADLRERRQTSVAVRDDFDADTQPA